jgi:hypothetical protein
MAGKNTNLSVRQQAIYFVVFDIRAKNEVSPRKNHISGNAALSNVLSSGAKTT